MEAASIPEVLAPAGDRERLIAALRFGADAVYLGGKQFGMRAGSANFDPQELDWAVGECHRRGVRLYLTCNTVPTNSDLEQLPGFVGQAAEAGVDGMIVADIGVMMLLRRLAPGMPVHISTQAGVMNHLTATELYRLGASRVVLARELPLEEIRRIRENTPPELELEAFVHGAMCMSFSGRCLISNYLTGRDANRGACTQPCRWNYRLVEEKRPGVYFPIGEEEGGSYLLNAQDLCMIEHIDKLADAGISSFKIEGRAKSAYYVAVITNAYRHAVDLYRQDPEHFSLPEWLSEETRRVSHREYSTGFYFGTPQQCYQSGGYLREWEIIADIDGWEAGYLICTERNRFQLGEAVEVLSPHGQPYPFVIESMRDGDGNPIQLARNPMMRVMVGCSRAFPEGSILRRMKQA